MSIEASKPATNILVVEDEMILCMRAVDIVEDAGYTAIEAVNADDALSILEGRSDIALLFSDIQMPGSMDGLKLAHAVHTRWPAIKIVLVSGHVKVTEADKPTDSLFFGKPLAVNEMVTELQAMLGASHDGSPPTNIAVRPAKFDGQESLTAENDSLRLLLEEAAIDAKVLLAQAGIDAKEREAADKLQTLILEEMHHRIKNTLGTVAALHRKACELHRAWNMPRRPSTVDCKLLDVPTICFCR